MFARKFVNAVGVWTWVYKRGCHVLDSLAFFKKVISVKEGERILESFTNS